MRKDDSLIPQPINLPPLCIPWCAAHSLLVGPFNRLKRIMLVPTASLLSPLINNRIWLNAAVCFWALCLSQALMADSNGVQGSLWNPPKTATENDVAHRSTLLLVEKVLAKADTALAANRLTLPEHNNAYDRYRAVLQIDPDNIRAKAGLLKIRDIYLTLIDQAVAREDVATANQYMRIVVELFPGDSSVAEARRTVRKLAPKPQAMPDVNNFKVTRFDLPTQDLGQRGKLTQSFLEALADRLSQTGESVLIRARNDAEGRWIYQTMNAATPTFRVRGDISISASPSIELQPPL